MKLQEKEGKNETYFEATYYIPKLKLHNTK